MPEKTINYFCIFPEEVDYRNGKLGMELWKILVLGVLRLIYNLEL